MDRSHNMLRVHQLEPQHESVAGALTRYVVSRLAEWFEVTVLRWTKDLVASFEPESRSTQKKLGCVSCGSIQEFVQIKWSSVQDFLEIKWRSVQNFVRIEGGSIRSSAETKTSAEIRWKSIQCVVHEIWRRIQGSAGREWECIQRSVESKWTSIPSSVQGALRLIQTSTEDERRSIQRSVEWIWSGIQKRAEGKCESIRCPVERPLRSVQLMSLQGESVYPRPIDEEWRTVNSKSRSIQNESGSAGNKPKPTPIQSGSTGSEREWVRDELIQNGRIDDRCKPTQVQRARNRPIQDESQFIDDQFISHVASSGPHTASPSAEAGQDFQESQAQESASAGARLDDRLHESQGRCEWTRSHVGDPTGERAIPCGSSADFVCESCGFLCLFCLEAAHSSCESTSESTRLSNHRVESVRICRASPAVIT
jgi:hypothetical protein